MLDLAQSQVKIIKKVAKSNNVATMKLFGSRAKGTSTDESDIDLLVSFHETPSLIELVNLKEQLEQALGLSVDLVQEDGLSPHLKDSILAGAQPL